NGESASTSAFTSAAGRPCSLARWSKYHFKFGPHTWPGATELTRIPYEPHSRAIVRATDKSAAFAAEYAPSSISALRAASDETKTTEPERCSFIAGSTAFAIAIEPITLMRNARSHSSAD